MPAPDLRIIRGSRFKIVLEDSRYEESRAREPNILRRVMVEQLGLKMGKAYLPFPGIHLEDENKGYSKDFVDYDTYDEVRNINYYNNNEKFRYRKKYGEINN